MVENIYFRYVPFNYLFATDDLIAKNFSFNSAIPSFFFLSFFLSFLPNLLGKGNMLKQKYLPTTVFSLEIAILNISHLYCAPINIEMYKIVEHPQWNTIGDQRLYNKGNK